MWYRQWLFRYFNVAAGSATSPRQRNYSPKKARGPLSFEMLEDRVVPATVTWINSGSGNWDVAANWSTDSVPTSGDTAVISTAGSATITIKSGDNIQIQAVTTSSTDTLALTGGSLQVSAGASTLSGPLSMANATLTATGSGVTFTASSTTTVGESSLYAEGGAQIALPNLTSTITNGTFEAYGNNGAGLASVLNLSGLTKVTQQGGWSVNANSGGEVNLSGLTSLTSTQGIYFNDTGNSTLLDPNLTSLVGVNVTLDGTDANAANSWTTFDSGNLTIQGGSYNLPKLTVVNEASIYAESGGQLTLPNLTSIITSGTFQAEGTNTSSGQHSLLNISAVTKVTQANGWTVNAYTGGEVNLTGLTSLTSTNNISINDTGGSTILDPNLTALSGTTGGLYATLDGSDANVASSWTKFVNGSLTVENGGTYTLPNLTNVNESSLYAENGGQLTLPDLTSYISRGTFQAQGTDTSSGQASLLNVSALTNLTQANGWTVNAYTGGEVNLTGLTALTSTQGITINDTGSSTILDPNLTALSGAAGGLYVTLDGTDANVANSWTKFSNATLTVNNGGSYTLPNLTNVNQSSLYAESGGQLTLPNLTSYQSWGTFQAEGMDSSTGQASLLNVSALTTLTQLHGWTINAYSGGTVNLTGLTSLNSTQGITINDTGGSTILDPNLTTLAASTGGLYATLDGTDANVANSWTKFFGGYLTVENGGSYTLANLTDVDQSNLYAENGGQLTLPNLTSYQSWGTFQAEGMDSSTGQASLLNVSALTTVTQLHGWTINAYGGGTVNLTGLTSLNSTQGITINDTGGSTILDPNLTTLAASTGGLYATLDGTDANVANSWTKFFGGYLTVENGGSYTLANLTDVDQSNLYAENGGQLTLPNLTSYQSWGTFQAEGMDSSTGQASLLDVSALTTVTQLHGWTVNAYSGGTVNLSSLTSLISTQGISVNDTGSSTILDPALATLNGTASSLYISTDGTDEQLGASWATLQSVTLSISGGTLPLPKLTGLASSTLDLSGGASVAAAGAVDIAGTIPVSGSGSLSFGGSPDVAGATVTAENGASIAFPASSTYTGTATLIATGSGSAISFANTTIAEPTDAGSVLLIESQSGGAVNAPDLTSISGGPVVLLSNGSGSSIGLTALQSFTSSGGGTASSGGAIQAGITLPAAPDVWLNQSNDYWSDGSAWLLGTPTASMPVLINTQASVTITLYYDEAVSVSSVQLGANDTIEIDDLASLSTAAAFENDGTLSLDAGGILHVGGNLTQGSSATINEQIGGTPASNYFGSASVAGTAALAGTFNLTLIDSYTPTIGQNYPVLAFASSTGNFSTLTGLDEGGQVFTETIESKSLNLVVNPTPPTFTADTPPVAGVGSAYSYQFEANGTAPITFSAVGLPAWAQLSTSGLLTGTPPAVGTWSFTVTASNGIPPDASANVSLSAQLEPPVFVNDSPPAGIGGSPYSYQFLATGTGIQPLTYSGTGLPAWAQLNATTGALTGTPIVDGTYSFSVTASNGITPNATANVTVVVAGGTAQTITVPAGTSYTLPSGSYAGGTTFDVGANATLTIDAGTFTGGGIFDVATGGTVDIIDSPSFAGTLVGGGGGTVQVYDGRMYIGSGGLTLDFPGSMFQWTGGQMDAGNGDLTNLGTMTVTAPVDFYNDGLLDNFGTIVQTGSGNIQLGTDGTFPATLKNEASGSYLLEGDGGLSEISDSGSAPGQTSLDNAGTIEKNGGTGTSGLDVLGSIANTGTIAAASGSIALSADLGISQLTGATLTGGTWSAQNGASIQFPSGTNITANDGTLSLGGVGAAIDGISSLASNSGSLTLTAGANFSTTGNFANAGSLTVGPASTLTVSGTATQTSAGTLTFQIGGAPAGGQFGRVAITGTADLGGGLGLSLVDGYTPGVGQQYPVMSFANSTGSFSSASLGRSFSQSLSATSLVLNSTVANPTDLAVSNVVVPSMGTAGQPITVTWQATDISANNASGNWQDSVYLSTTDAITASSTLLGTFEHTGGLIAAGSYDGTLTAAVPAIASGSYYAFVVVDSLNQLSDPNRANNTLGAGNQLAVSLPSLTLGTPASGSFSSANQAEYYQVAVPAGGSLQVALTSAASSGATALYVSSSSLPTPYAFQYSADAANEPNQTLVVPQVASPTTYYILAESVSGAAAAAGFTIAATQTGALTVNVPATPYVGGNGGNLTIPIGGTNFSSGVTASLTLGGTTIAASSIDFVNAGQFYATFPLSGAATGNYTLQVTSGGQTVTAPTTVKVSLAVGASNPVQLNLTTPANVRAGRDGYVTVIATNTSNNDVLAPLLQLTANGASLELPSQSTFQGTSVNFLATSSTGPAGILTPGESTQLTIQFQASTGGGSQIDFQVNSSDDSQPMNWASQESALQIPTIPNAAWPIVFANFEAAMGTTVASYHAVLAADATYLAKLGDPTNDVLRLTEFEIEKANATYTSQTLDSFTAADLPAPGEDLKFTQSYLSAISGRYYTGIVGAPGWTTNWDITAKTTATGDVSIQISGAYFFFFRQADGSFQAGPGGEAVALSESGGAYRMTEPTGVVYQFNSDGSLNYVQDASGNRVSATYNGSGQLVRLLDSNGEYLTLQYNGSKQLTTLTDSNGQIETYGYTGSELTSFTELNATTTFSYAAGGTAAQNGSLSGISLPDGTQMTFTFDGEGRLIDEHRNGGADDLAFAYLAPGGIVQTDANGNSTTYYFDLFGAVAETVDALGSATFYQYDANLNLTEIVAPGGLTSTYEYNAQNQLTSETDPLGNTTTFAYEGNNLSSYTDANGNSTNYAYDGSNNLLSISYANGTSESLSYNPLGEATGFLTADGSAISATYNSDGLITQESFADGTSYAYAYDVQGDMTSATDAQGRTTSFVYGSASNPSLLTEVEYPDGTWLKFTYSTAGQRTQSVDSAGFTVEYAYNPQGWLTGLTDGSGNTIVEYKYSAVGNLVEKDDGNGTFTTYAYDADERLTEITNYAPSTGGTPYDPSNSTVTSFDAYTYDALGNILTDTDRDGEWTYTYNADSELTGATFAPNGTNPDSLSAQAISYSYDAVGNRTSETVNGVVTTFTIDGVNEYTSSATAGVGTTTYHYDNAGNLISETDPLGNSTTYTYSELNELTGVSSPGLTAAYAYNPLGQMVSQTANGATTNYQVDPAGGGSVAAAYAGTGEYANTSLIANYASGLGLVEQVAAGGVASYYAFDVTGNTVALTGSSGSVEDSYTYLPFGQVATTTGATANPFTFVGAAGVLSLNDGLFAMGARAYSATLGQFTSADPTGLSGGDPNVRRYANDNPIGITDPSGLSICWYGPFGQNPFVHGGPDHFLGLSIGNSVGFSSGFFYGEAVGASVGGSVGLGAAAGVGPGGFIGPSVEAGVNAGVASIGGAGAGVGLHGGFGAGVSADIVQLSANVASYGQSFGFGLGYSQGSTDGFIFGFGDCPCECPPNNSPNNPNKPGPNGNTNSNGPQDPNALIGPTGFGSQGFILDAGNLGYTVQFENDGTAAADDVVVTQQLSSNLDWSTFQLGSFGFGPISVAVPAGMKQYQTTVHYQNSDGTALNVLVNLTFDVDTGALTVTMTSLDPATGQTPAGIFDGFLYPNDAAGDGEGYVQYTAQPKSGLATATSIAQQAAVVFDTNSSIGTNTATNAIDATPPAASVVPLASTLTSKFLVNWAGTDSAGPGIGTYSVYVSANGASYTPWLVDTTATSGVYSGTIGDSYSFYAVATDLAGLVQTTPTSPQATTSIVKNPASSLTKSTLKSSSTSIQSGTSATVTLQVVESTGQKAPSGGLVVAFSLGSKLGGQGTFSAVTDNGDGTYTVTFTGTTAGSNTIRATIGGLAVTSAAPTIKVTPGSISLAKSFVSASATSDKAGTAVLLTLQPEDAAGNKIVLPGQTVQFALGSGSTGSGTFGPVKYNANGTYTVAFTGTIAGTNSLVASIGGTEVTSKAPTVTVTPGTASTAHSYAIITSGSVVAGNSVTLTLQAVDAYGNLEKTGGLKVAFALVSATGGRGVFGTVKDNKNGTYTVTFTGTTAGKNTIVATIGGLKLAAAPPAINVTPGAVSPAKSVLLAAPTSAMVGGSITVTLEAKDAYGNLEAIGGLIVAFALSSAKGAQGTFGPVTDHGNGTYTAVFTPASVGTNLIVATIGNSKVTSLSPSIKVIA